MRFAPHDTANSVFTQMADTKRIIKPFFPGVFVHESTLFMDWQQQQSVKHQVNRKHSIINTNEDSDEEDDDVFFSEMDSITEDTNVDNASKDAAHDLPPSNSTDETSSNKLIEKKVVDIGTDVSGTESGADQPGRQTLAKQVDRLLAKKVVTTKSGRVTIMNNFVHRRDGVGNVNFTVTTREEITHNIKKKTPGKRKNSQRRSLKVVLNKNLVSLRTLLDTQRRNT